MNERGLMPREHILRLFVHQALLHQLRQHQVGAVQVAVPLQASAELLHARSGRCAVQQQVSAVQSA